MAASGLWVKVAATLPRHYKTEALARALNLPIHEVVGKLVSLWIYAVEFANAGVLTLDDVRRGFLSHDEPQDYESVMLVIAALRDCGMPHHAGFIEEYQMPDDDEDTTVKTWLLHDWDSYSGTYQPGMVRDENGDLSVTYYKKRRGTKRVKKEEKTAGEMPDGGASAEKPVSTKETPRTAETEKPLSALLPRVLKPLVDGEGYNFSRTREALRARL